MHNLETDKLISRLQDFSPKVLIVGDLMLDEYLRGTVCRISPEAPVPVVELSSKTYALGGAGNVACNVRSLGARPILAGVVGADKNGAILRQIASTHDIDISGVINISGRPTTTKTRVTAPNQQLLRIDSECRDPFSSDIENQILSTAKQLLPDIDCCVISDYNKGLISVSLCKSLIDAARALRKPVVVDPKGEDFSKYAGALVVTPNLREAELALKEQAKTPGEVSRCGERLQKSLHPTAVLLTLGADGMVLFSAVEEPYRLPAQARSVFDVTGAGDTVVSTLAFGISIGANLKSSVWLANLAAGIVVEKRGTASVSIDELSRSITSVQPSRKTGEFFEQPAQAPVAYSA